MNFLLLLILSLIVCFVNVTAENITTVNGVKSVAVNVTNITVGNLEKYVFTEEKPVLPEEKSVLAVDFNKKTAVVAVDVQLAFYLGSLPVTGSNASKIMAFIYELHKILNIPIISTKDSHPLHHISQVIGKGAELRRWEKILNITILDSEVNNYKSFSFIDPMGVKREQMSWPVHGLKGGKTNNHGFWEGDDLLPKEEDIPGLEEISTYIQLKGENPLYDSYSGFSDDGGHKTGLETYLKTNGFTQLIVVGEAGNYCVKASILDALTAGFEVILISDMTHYIPASEESKTLREIKNHAEAVGGKFSSMTSSQFKSC